MFCTCDAAEWRHHHAFGGVYPCEGPQTCARCHDIDERLWGGPLPPVTSVKAGQAYIRRRYGTRNR